MKAYGYGLIIVLQFFSVFPIRREVPMTSKYLERAVRMFPVFGLLLGVIYAGVAFGLLEYTPLSALAVAFCMWFFPIMVTGGIHLDGWMDSSDAFFSYRDQKKRLEILQDPQIGAFGVLSVIVLLSAKFLFIYETMEAYTSLTLLLLVCIPVYSRTVMGMMLMLVPTAKKSGLGFMFQQTGKTFTLWSYLPILFVIPLAMFVYSWTAGLIALGMLVLTLFVFYGLRKKAISWFGGITGDVVGAAAEGVEVFLWLILWVLHYYVMG